MVNKKKVLNDLRNASATQQRLKRQDFDLTNGTSGVETKIASYEAESPIVLREDAMRLMFVTVEQFSHTGSGSETFNLANDIISTSNTTDIVLFDDGNRVQPSSVDYAANTFDYYDEAAATLHVAYVPADASKIRIEKSSPKSQGRVTQTVFTDVSKALHETNQNKQPPSMNFQNIQANPFKPVVPRKWTLDVYADGPVAFEWDDSDTGNPQGVTASNAVMSLPVNRAKSDIENLSAAVKADIIE
ncbi:hypothetical protein [Haloarchaeobius sp. HME9146]|uniref:hypothetical protein n=1 Tax=Haloarchaeobius sp. HME9146 TaxID=2978732 RepID=UPI0021BFCEB5|nr:hypothetical protein [Haloarchaeobius sp. HME9146]MCT9095278.1 hypothetical protein [Haloarchaeobius sp. HME9146]